MSVTPSRYDSFTDSGILEAKDMHILLTQGKGGPELLKFNAPSHLNTKHSNKQNVCDPV